MDDKREPFFNFGPNHIFEIIEAKHLQVSCAD